jgi:hypothetical protein
MTAPAPLDPSDLITPAIDHLGILLQRLFHDEMQSAGIRRLHRTSTRVTAISSLLPISRSSERATATATKMGARSGGQVPW